MEVYSSILTELLEDTGVCLSSDWYSVTEVKIPIYTNVLFYDTLQGRILKLFLEVNINPSHLIEIDSERVKFKLGPIEVIALKDSLLYL